MGEVGMCVYELVKARGREVREERIYREQIYIG